MEFLSLKKALKKIKILTISSLLFALTTFSPMAASQSRTGVDIDTLGPQVGEPIPQFELPDQNGDLWSIDSIKGSNGAMLLFHRSADW